MPQIFEHESNESHESVSQTLDFRLILNGILDRFLAEGHPISSAGVNCPMVKWSNGPINLCRSVSPPLGGFRGSFLYNFERSDPNVLLGALLQSAFLSIRENRRSFGHCGY